MTLTPPPPTPRLHWKSPQRQPQKWLDRQLKEDVKAVGGGYCPLQMPLKLALAVGKTVAGHRLGTLEGGGGTPPPLQCIPAPPPFAYCTGGESPKQLAKCLHIAHCAPPTRNTWWSGTPWARCCISRIRCGGEHSPSFTVLGKTSKTSVERCWRRCRRDAQEG